MIATLNNTPDIKKFLESKVRPYTLIRDGWALQFTISDTHELFMFGKEFAAFEELEKIKKVYLNDNFVNYEMGLITTAQYEIRKQQIENGKF